MRKQTQAAESILTKLRFRDDELKTWQVSRRAIKISMFYSKHTHFHGSRRCLKMEILFFFLLLTTNCCNFFDDCFSRQEAVPISVKSLDGEAALRGRSCAMGVGLFTAQWWRGGGGSKRLILWLPRWEFTWDVQNVGNILASVCRSKLFFPYRQWGLCCPPEDKPGD